MEVKDITFGIEIETVIPSSTNIEIGDHGEGCDIDELPGWLADEDGSIRNPRGYLKCEFVSPVFKGLPGFE